ATRDDWMVRMEHGQPLRFGTDGTRGVVRDPRTGAFSVADIAEVGEGSLLVHDSHSPDPTTAFAISRLTDAGYLHQAPIGIFRQVDRPTYDDLARDQLVTARGDNPEESSDRLAALIGGGDTWTVV
ncbi:MAG: 2-oxoacid:ferredoxin oxidoreductase subunit beta, partial [Nocardioides sp.]